MTEISILKHLCSKEFFETHRDSIKLEYISKELHPVLRTLDAYFNTSENPTTISTDDLSNLYFAKNRQKLEFYMGIFDALRVNTSTAESTVELIKGLQNLSKLRELSLLAYEAAEGRATPSSVIELAGGLSTSSTNPDVTDDTDSDWVSDDLEILINETQSQPGLRWRLDSLNKSLGSLRKGDFGFLFARPETGKTTFLASEVSHMATQSEGPILWFNNEEQGNKVMLRCYQATLGITLEQLMSDLKGNRQKFHDLTKSKIKLKDSASIHHKTVERICEELQPSLVVFDQIDKIKGFDSDREDLRLGSIYIWARELAKQYCPVIGVCQADGSGEGVRWLSMANVANAKTSKQAEADWILGIGAVNDPGYEALRFLHLSKNKLMGDKDTRPEQRHGRWEVLIEPIRARYIDL